MSNSLHPLPVLSPTTNPTASMTAPYAQPSMELVLTRAKARVANFVRNSDVNGLDPFLMVIEDEFGELVHTQGNLSFLMPAAPVLREWFAGQLNAGIKDEYDRKQHAVWQEMLFHGQQFQVASNLNAAILPFLAEEERFTVTAFISRPKNKW